MASRRGAVKYGAGAANLVIIKMQAQIDEQNKKIEKQQRRLIDAREEALNALRQLDTLNREHIELTHFAIEVTRELRDVKARLNQILNPLQERERGIENTRPESLDALFEEEKGHPTTLGEGEKEHPTTLVGEGKEKDVLALVGKETNTLFQCSRCKSAQYENKDAQLADWPIHKLVCAPPE